MEEKEKLNSRKLNDLFIRIISILTIIGIVVADYVGFKSSYANFILGGSVTVYIFGRKGLIIILSKFSGMKLSEVEEYLDG